MEAERNVYRKKVLQLSQEVTNQKAKQKKKKRRRKREERQGRELVVSSEKNKGRMAAT